MTVHFHGPKEVKVDVMNNSHRAYMTPKKRHLCWVGEGGGLVSIGIFMWRKPPERFFVHSDGVNLEVGGKLFRKFPWAQ